MNGRKIFGIALLIGAFVYLVVGSSMYRMGGNSLAAVYGVVMAVVGGGVFGLLGLLFFFGGPLRTAAENIEARSRRPWNRVLFPIAMLVGLVMGAALLWLAAAGVIHGEFQGRRGSSTVFRDKPVAFLVQLVLYGGLGGLFLWGCGKTVLECFVPPRNEDDDRIDKPSAMTGRGGVVDPRDSSRPGTKR